MTTQPQAQSIGHRIKNLNEGQRVKVMSNQRDHPVLARVKKVESDNGFHEAIIEDLDGDRFRLTANWRDIPESKPNNDPFTGLAPVESNDTAPPVTELKTI